MLQKCKQTKKIVILWLHLYVTRTVWFITKSEYGQPLSHAGQILFFHPTQWERLYFLLRLLVVTVASLQLVVWLAKLFPFLPDEAIAGRAFQRGCLLTFTAQPWDNLARCPACLLFLLQLFSALCFHLSSNGPGSYNGAPSSGDVNQASSTPTRPLPLFMGTVNEFSIYLQVSVLIKRNKYSV